MHSATWRKLGIALAIVGLIAVAVGVAYFVIPTGKLPSVLGRIANGTGHHDKRGTAALVVGVLMLIGSAVSFAMVRARRRRRSPSA